jgi:hypothetical protein
LPKGLGTHHHGTLVVLQGPGDDLRGGGRAGVDQHHHRSGPGVGRQTLHEVVLVAALVVLRAGQVAALGVFGAAVGRGDQRLGLQEGGGNADGAIEQAAGIVAQIEHQALDAHALGVLVLLGQLFKVLHHVRRVVSSWNWVTRK